VHNEVSPVRLMVAGFVLLLGSWLVILLMVIGEITPSLLLSLGAYAASVAGLAIGLFGVAQYARERSRRRGPEE
jgi:membrane associated rhomboid family serine protease